MKELELKNYKITWDEIDSSKIPVSLKMELEDIYKTLGNPKNYTLKRLKRLIKKYPTNLQLRNYLSVAYHNMGNPVKAEQVNEETLKNFLNIFLPESTKLIIYFKKSVLKKQKI